MSTPNFSVKNKIVVITGGSGVLGGSLAKSFAHAGASVVILGQTPEKVRASTAALQEINPKCKGYVCNVLEEEPLREVAKEIVSDFGTVDVLINAAGGNTPKATIADDKSLFDMNLSDFDFALQLNLHGTIYPSFVFGEIMAKKGRGSIINISSMAALSAITRVPAYSVAKTGVDGFTKWLATEMALKFGDKVRVNSIAPGFFIGDQNRKLLLNNDGSLTERSEKVIAKTPMRRFGDIDELNGAAQFLSSEAASFITGVVIPVDGGFSSFSGV